jgi:hypothetical protein
MPWCDQRRTPSTIPPDPEPRLPGSLHLSAGCSGTWHPESASQCVYGFGESYGAALLLQSLASGAGSTSKSCLHQSTFLIRVAITTPHVPGWVGRFAGRCTAQRILLQLISVFPAQDQSPCLFLCHRHTLPYSPDTRSRFRYWTEPGNAAVPDGR